MSTTVKLDDIGKQKLERLQAKLRLDTNLKLDQYKLLRSLITFGEEHYSDFLTYLQGTYLTKDEIKEFHSKYIKEGVYYYPDKSDDELIYGD